MNSNLYCVLYHSQLAPGAPFSSVSEIIKIARNSNPKHGLTGMLVFDGEYFLQYLEGEKQPLWDLLVRIAQDPRHVNFTLQHQGMCNGERLFGNWSMGYAQVDDADPLSDHFELMGEEALANLHAMLPTLDIA